MFQTNANIGKQLAINLTAQAFLQIFHLLLFTAHRQVLRLAPSNLLLMFSNFRQQ